MKPRPLSFALHSAAAGLPELPDGYAYAACRELPQNTEAEGAIPERFEVIPGGENVIGRDGRSFVNDQPATVAANYTEPVAVDENHSSDNPFATTAPAVGWVNGWEVGDDGAIFAVGLQWNEVGERLMRQRAYRWVSPVILHDDDGRVIKIVGVGLTNRPNLRLQALNNNGGRAATTENPMNLKQQILKALGLDDATTDADLVAALKSMHSRSAELTTQIATLTAQAADAVPRSDLALALNRVQELEAAFAERDAAEVDAEITAAIDEAVRAGKVTPANRDWHQRNLKRATNEATREAITDFRSTYLANAPVVIDPAKPAEKPAASLSLNAQQRDVCKRMGIDPEAYAAQLKRQAEMASEAI